MNRRVENAPSLEFFLQNAGGLGTRIVKMRRDRERRDQRVEQLFVGRHSEGDDRISKCRGPYLGHREHSCKYWFRPTLPLSAASLVPSGDYNTALQAMPATMK